MGNLIPTTEPETSAGPRAERQPAPWFDRTWAWRKRIVLPGDRIPGDLHDFPLLIVLDNDPHVARESRPDGRDLRFTAADGVSPLPHERVVHQRILREQGVWTIWTGPRALRHVGRHDRTYVTYYTINDGWWISAFDHRRQEWQHQQLRAHEPSADGRWWDDHNNPAITVRRDGRLVVVYGEHSTERSWCRISREPEEIAAWEPEIPFPQEERIAARENASLRRFLARVKAKLTRTKPPSPYQAAYSYVNLYTLPDGTLWRQYRPLRTWSGLSRCPSFLVSSDGGESWSEPVRFLEEEGRTPYLVTAQQGNRIHFFFSDAHPDEWARTSIYHAYYDHADQSYRRSDGSWICDQDGLPFSPSDATRVFDGTTLEGEAWVYDVAVDENGHVAGLFNVYAGGRVGLPSHRIHEYRYAFWDGAEWSTGVIASERDLFSSGQRRYSGGFVVDPADLSTVYLSLVDPDLAENSFTRHIWRYRTPDRGKSWERTQISRPGQGKAHSRPVVPLNRHPELPLLWQYGHYLNYLEYRTSLVAGDHGELLDSQHYVRVPRLRPGEDLVIYVYYGNPEAEDTNTNERVWPSSCLLAYRGTLTQNDLRWSIGEAGTALTFELTATWGSDRKGREHAPLLSNGRKQDAAIMIAKTADAKLETRVLSDGRQRVQVFEDLVMTTRHWRNAFDPVESAIIQVGFIPGAGVHVWLNGEKSAQVGEIGERLGGSDAFPDTLRVGYGPGQEEITFQGWVETVRIYEGDPGETWLALSADAERNHRTLLRIGPPEPPR